MLIAGLTGGLACGKTFVANELRRLGCHVIEADTLGREAIRRGAECFAPVVEAFGEDILSPSGEIDRAALARAVFGDPAQLAALNAIVHPAVRRRSLEIFADLAERDPGGIAIYTAAILIETGSAREFSRLILVTCTRQQQLARSLARGATEADVLARLDRQSQTEEKLPFADFVIDASQSETETLRQTKIVWEKLKELAL